MQVKANKKIVIKKIFSIGLVKNLRGTSLEYIKCFRGWEFSDKHTNPSSVNPGSWKPNEIISDLVKLFDLFYADVKALGSNTFP